VKNPISEWWESGLSSCRYGDIVGKVFHDCLVIWAETSFDFSGSAHVFGVLPDGRFFCYAWVYGSCVECDCWERRGLSNEQIEAEVRRDALYFESVDEARRYLGMVKNMPGAVEKLDKWLVYLAYQAQKKADEEALYREYHGL
jgi:hypothetical protein